MVSFYKISSAFNNILKIINILLFLRGVVIFRCFLLLKVKTTVIDVSYKLKWQDFRAVGLAFNGSSLLKVVLFHKYPHDLSTRFDFGLFCSIYHYQNPFVTEVTSYF